MNVKVSVIIPTYKRSEFLLRAVDSILKQDYPNIEIIVIDDNNPNSNYRLETEKKMKVYNNRKNIIYIKNEENLGGALARNKGILIATGEFITFLDDDDIYLPNKISSQLQYMLNGNLDLSFTNVRIHNLDDNLVDFRDHTYINSYDNVDLLKQHILHHLTPTATYMFKKDSLLKIGGFPDVRMGQEFMLMLKAIKSGLKIGYIREANVIQYLHDGERISVGLNKIEAEKDLYNFKKQYFNILSKSEKKYVSFRHYAVLSIVGLRSKNYYIFINNFLKCLLISPINLVKELYYQLTKIKRYRY